MFIIDIRSNSTTQKLKLFGTEDIQMRHFSLELIDVIYDWVEEDALLCTYENGKGKQELGSGGRRRRLLH